MLELSPYATAFLAALLGGIHCVGMCGGIVGALSLGTLPVQKTPLQQFPVLLGYNLGRITSYVVAGLIVGSIGAGVTALGEQHSSQQILKIIAGIFMILLGLYIANIWTVLSKTEELGKHLWQRIEPFGRKFIPVTSFSRAIPLGLVWGWLPCGLVYNTLVLSLTTGSAVQGGLVMLAFGLGTLPALLAMGLFASKLSTFTRNPAVKLIAGLIIIFFGGVMLWQAIQA